MDFAQFLNWLQHVLASAGTRLAELNLYQFWVELVGDTRIMGLLNLLLLVYVITNERRRSAEQDAAVSYNDLDNIYQRLLEQRVNRPWLKDARLFQSGGAIPQTEAAGSRRAHAYAVWTFLETIKDRLRCEKREKVKEEMQRVWQPVIRSEGSHYLDELCEFCETDSAFNQGFIEFICRGGFAGIYGKRSQDEFETQRFAKLATDKLIPVLNRGNTKVRSVAAAA